MRACSHSPILVSHTYANQRDAALFPTLSEPRPVVNP
jgi:hypothetical protein